MHPGRNGSHVASISMAEANELLSRRRFLRNAAITAGAVVAGPTLWRRPGWAAVAPKGMHLAFGADPRSEMSVSWSTSQAVEQAAIDYGLGPSYGQSVIAETRTTIGSPTLYHHARLAGLAPDTTYHYRVRHDGGAGADATFRTAPVAQAPFTFTAFGDQGVSGSASETTQRLLAIAPAFHLHAGDICYAYQTGTGDLTKPAPLYDALRSRLTNPAVWDTWLAMTSPQASRAPWMTIVGNHEMEYGYGPLGYDGYLARFSPPLGGAPGGPVTYAFRYGSVGIVALDGNDASAEIPPNRGYLGAIQDSWLRATLSAMRADPTIDFIVAGFHNCAYCSNVVHASDGGVRARWGSIFDEFSVDVVVNGHNHNYERSHPIRSGAPTAEVAGGGVVRAARDGTTYVTAGGGGQTAYQTSLYPLSYVTIEPGARVPEAADWSATRYLDISLVAFDVAPRDGTGRAAMTMRALRPDGTEIEHITFEHLTA